ncbi:MAG: phage tail protein [Pseudomonadota bacterium]
MATLLLTAVGTAIGGPFGGALGALVGQQADRAIFGSGSAQGPRLKELSVTTSSYGQPIARHFGRMRVAGSVIWATDLVEQSSTQGGKGKPKTTTYSYSASFAVALSSTPIQRLGRVWADGNLLRGSAGDLKVEGDLRVYLGEGDDRVDPLIAADKGEQAPAFRDCAYVVFESLQLADFGNRIPALTFEIFAEEGENFALTQLVPSALKPPTGDRLENTRGFADEGGPLSGTLSAIDQVYPLVCLTTPEGLALETRAPITQPLVTLPEQLATQEPDEGGRFKSRANAEQAEPLALRYYDEDRDYQPGVQRAIGRRPNGRERTIDLPATLTANGAKALVNANANRARWRNETITWRVGELDPYVRPGSVVRLPENPGIWRVMSWEWFDQGIELTLERVVAGTVSSAGADTGAPTPPQDLTVGVTQLRFFELPAEDTSPTTSPLVFAAASSSSAAWNGAALFAEQSDTLVPLESTGRDRSTMGALSAPLEPSNALLFEPEAAMEVHGVAGDLLFTSTDIAGLAAGANRLLAGGEIVQFQSAVPLGDGQWRLCGLLRGRAGTEEHAAKTHPAQTPVTLLDTSLIDLTGASNSSSQRIAAIGRGDEEAVYAALDNPGLSRRPLTPVHPRSQVLADGVIEWCWTRRARGQWVSSDGVEVPLVEESESYAVGYGPVDAPHTAFAISEARFILSPSQRAELVSTHGAADLWVQQIGTFARSSALWLSHLS